MTTKELINENVGLQCRIRQVIYDLVDARLHKDSHKEAEWISRMGTLLVGIEQHLQCTEGFLEDSKSVEPKFKVGDKIVRKNIGCCVPLEITGVSGEYYYSNTPNSVDVLPIKDQNDWELITIIPKFKVGDKIVDKSGLCTYIIKSVSDEYYGLELPHGIGVMPVKHQDDWELVPNKFDINTLIPFESKVLVRNYDDVIWKPAVFGFYHKEAYNKFAVIGGISWGQCIPFEGNEHLLGTTDDCDECYKNW